MSERKSDADLPALVEAYRDTAFQDVTNPLSHYRRAHEYRERGDHEGWREAIDAALRLPHLTPQQRNCRAWVKLALGDWSGWEDYETRFLAPADPPVPTSLADWIRWTHARWDGVEDLRGQTLLVFPEQGMGDSIQMLRFLPVLASRAAQVIAMVYPRLVPLVQCNFSNCVTVVIHGVDKPIRFDRYVQSMSLPGLLGGLPPFAPLCSPKRRPSLPARTRQLRAGLCWAGNPKYRADEVRSMSAARLKPLLARPEIEWHSLQVGERAVDADAYPSMRRPWPSLTTFGDTADMISELDFVVAVDTAVAHLAGSLGILTYLLLPYYGDDRWGLLDRTPWYPSMRLVKQTVPGDWTGVIDCLQSLLDHISDEFTGAAPPTGNSVNESESILCAPV